MGKVSTSMTIDDASGSIFLGALPEVGLFSRAAHSCLTLILLADLEAFANLGYR
jgi:hypothetical protein